MDENQVEPMPVDYEKIDRRNVRSQCLHAAVDLHRKMMSNDLAGILDMAEKFAAFVLADG